MRIMFPDMHARMPYALGRAIEDWGTLLLPDVSFNGVIRYGEKWPLNQENVRGVINAVEPISLQKMLDQPPDILIVSCYEVEDDVLSLWTSSLRDRGTKLVHYAGNVDVPYNMDYVSAVLSPDITTYRKMKAAGKNVLLYFPFIDFETFYYEGENHTHVIGCYIKGYEANFPSSYKLAQAVVKAAPHVKHVFHESLSANKVHKEMQGTCATLHIKEKEGYGFTILESLAKGRPVILYGPYMLERTFNMWCKPGVNCIAFYSIEEYVELTKKLLRDTNWCAALQVNAVSIVRDVINNDEQSENLKHFLETLK